ncbi:MAG: efflux RND transporter periplasmic adaptor subunit [Candidatus Marinimicrobia bacterium]|nr:efflux RND transporter periplasmic adaptor subunit [Candidatus Neomarinimicrobiota bacterium]
MKKMIVLSLNLLILIFAGCSREKAETKSMEQIYRDEGVPVKIEKITTTIFEKSLAYNGMLTGIEQSSAHAAFGDEVEKVHVKVGDYVKKDQVLISFPTDAPTAQYSQAKAAFESMDKTYKRMKMLLDKGAVSQQDYENIETQYKVTEANWEMVRKMVKVKAPISGYVTKVSVNETDNVRSETELAVISNTDRLKTRIFVTEKDFPLLQKGQSVRARWNEKEISGKIVQVDLGKDMMQQGFGVNIEFDNPGNLFPPGITVELQIIIESNPEAIVVDKKYISELSGKYYVFLASADKAFRREVVLGDRSSLKYEILEGLAPGDNLIIEGHKIVKDAQKIKVLNRG